LIVRVVIVCGLEIGGLETATIISRFTARDPDHALRLGFLIDVIFSGTGLSDRDKVIGAKGSGN